jgi:DNA (cytosine-5)-methyltransferase 1
MTKEHLFPFDWELKNIESKHLGNVFSCFSCGGGSVLGYKLAGFDVVGCNEIDKNIISIYEKNINSEFNFCESIRNFKKRTDLPKELYQLDILDGSPPCSTFSLSGSREKSWGVEKVFHEGQQKQILDTLFFDFVEVAKKFQPKVVIAENVKGILYGNAIKYCQKIYSGFDEAGYECQHFVLNSKFMGVPQSRERVFFICLRKDLAKQFPKKINIFSNFPYLNLNFDEESITFGEIEDDKGDLVTSPVASWLYSKRKYGDRSLEQAAIREQGKKKNFNAKYIYKNKTPPTLDTKGAKIVFDTGRRLSISEIIKISTFPKDYNFCGKELLLTGMSVPPIMMAQIAKIIYEQILNKIQ